MRNPPRTAEPELAAGGPAASATAAAPIGRSDPGRKGTGIRRRTGKRVPLVLAVPFGILYAIFFVGPLVYALLESLQSPLTGGFAGTMNYETAAGSADFWSSMVQMSLFTVVQVAVMLSLALALALLLDSKYCRGKSAFSIIYFLPYAVPGVIAAIMWAFILSPQTDSLLRAANASPLESGGVFYVILTIVTWEWTGYNITLFLAGLTSIPAAVVDAARLDGCGEFRLAWHIKLKMLRPIIAFTCFASLIGTFQLFNEPDVINFIHPLPANYTPNLLIYNTAFRFGNIPLASAESMILAALTIGAALVFTLLARRRNRT
ncbi:carbohydrate ABC transporter permease [Sinomonas terrae]|uniref:Sugar ABC transporter permease n=1 Tax=Sinomonas terrae TaxID=2908838 RepID=A0ABS9U6P1_9MICC|nr:sugar ABC transporter permease [Sinomonas terrae]MCH6472372.1 sugar ABC transporter permease [Sinomonas terrae]